jgi:protein-S-isoprenylcysteine O-methyltransferase Ste14
MEPSQRPEGGAAQDHADVHILPPLLFLGSIALGALLHWLVALPLGAGGGLRVAAGLALVALGVAAMAWTLVWMRRTQQDPDPRKPSPELIVGGPFRFSRNPIYVGMALIQLGIGLGLGSAWILLLLPPTLWWLRRGVIEPEEAYLGRRFGAAYAAYKASVRRWL